MSKGIARGNKTLRSNFEREETAAAAPATLDTIEAELTPAIVLAETRDADGTADPRGLSQCEDRELPLGFVVSRPVSQ